jgi:streptogramin lyase
VGGEISEFSIPTGESAPFGIVAGADGNVWFTEEHAEKIGRITPGGTISEFPVGSRPFGITAGPDGNLWFTGWVERKIGRISPSGAVTEFQVGESSRTQEITAGPEGNLWFSEFAANKIGRMTPSGALSEFSVPTEEGFPSAITAGPGGTLWVTEEIAGKIARIDPRLLTACVVPKLRGKTLAKARKLLLAEQCGLGKVTKPAKRKHKLVVVAQKPAAKKVLPHGARVNLRLG